MIDGLQQILFGAQVEKQLNINLANRDRKSTAADKKHYRDDGRKRGEKDVPRSTLFVTTTPISIKIVKNLEPPVK